MRPYHVMRVEVMEELGKVVLTCPTCDRCIDVQTSGGGVRILRRGDRSARHSGWSLPAGVRADGVAEVVQ
jgi:hypothetical protein